MSVAEQMRKSVAFIGCPLAGGEFFIAGTVFFFGVETEDGQRHLYAVTAKHVIDGLRKKGVKDVGIRVNVIDGGSQYYMTRIDDWYFDKDDHSFDVAIIEALLADHYDHTFISSKLIATSEALADMQLELGVQVLVIGLFTHHKGTKRNIPIARIGSLACLVEEKVVSPQYGEMDAYLVETHSIGGLSGSPVFLRPPLWALTDKGQPKLRSEGYAIYLIGIMHGHFDEVRRDAAQTNKTDRVSMINTGIAIVTPVDRLPRLVEKMKGEKDRQVHLTFADDLAPHYPSS
jgi:hypothetical protein